MADTAPAETGRGLGQDLVDLFDACYNDPLLFFNEVLGVKPRRWQREVLLEIGRRRSHGELHTQVHVRAAHGSGKGWLAGGGCLWWNGTRPGSRTLTTAPTWRGVEELLWTEIRRLYAGSLLAEMRLGRMLDTKWDMGHGWFAVGASSDQPANLEGQHSLVAAARIVDEAKAVIDPVFVATEGLLSSAETFDMWISTPSTRVGAFYRRDINGGDEVIRKVVTIEDLIADNVPGAQRWKDNAIVEYGGAQSFEYQSRAMALYVDDAEGALFPFSWIERAMMTDTERISAGLAVFHPGGWPTIGYDVAGSVDGDENATAPACGPDNELRYEILEIDHWHERDTMISKDRVIETARRLKARCVRVDVQGLGKGVGDAIAREVAERHLAYYVEEHRSADAPGNQQKGKEPSAADRKAMDRFVNKKAENAWSVRLSMEFDRVRLPKSAKLREQMAAMKYLIRNGKIQIVDPKDSPDWWDAVLIAIGGVYHSFSMNDLSEGLDATTYGPTEKTNAWGSPWS
jgi:hypothetical protein